MSGDSGTLAFYDNEAEAYAEFAAGHAVPDVLRDFAGMLPDGASVLDFRCGSGGARHWLARQGLDVTGFDGSEGLAQQARDRYGLEVTVGRFEDFNAETPHDGIWASFCLLHDRREAMPGHLNRLGAALRPGGVLYVGLIHGEGEHRDSLGRLYTHFTDAEMAELLGAAGFVDITSSHEPSQHYDGTPATNLHILARRA